MSTELEDILKSVAEGAVPQTWLARCYPTTELLASFLSDLQERLRFLKRRVFTARVDDLDTLHNGIVAGCQIIKNTPGTHQRIRMSVQGRVDTCVRDGGGHLEHFPLVPTISSNTCEWLTSGAPTKFWVPGLYRPQAFLTALQQTYARQKNVPIYQLSFEFQVMNETEVISHPEYGAYIYGLFLEGCRWNSDRSVLDESLPMQFYSLAPTVWVKPAVVAGERRNGTYACPVYRTPERRGLVSTSGHSSNFLLAVDLPSDRPSDHWVLRGVAMLCRPPS
ncbi:hypothetical protein PR048_008361 [Dryococelus australis]|uniref:Dynein heavy chain C-terminal domain-containing protein n=1 Tax=Dryococelus australis TaxID=614101 RepID=A0ABQ9HWW5_9NEOP|nr:hypothetical protein PR048_008361 [Dryococelus australis]